VLGTVFGGAGRAGLQGLVHVRPQRPGVLRSAVRSFFFSSLLFKLPRNLQNPVLLRELLVFPVDYLSSMFGAANESGFLCQGYQGVSKTT